MPNSPESRPLPSRRELRLARQRAAAQQTVMSEEPLTEKISSAQVQAAIASPALQVVPRSHQKLMAKTRSGLVRDRVASLVGAGLLAVSGGFLIGVTGSSNSALAHANINQSSPLLTAIKENRDTPASLLANSGAADAARFQEVQNSAAQGSLACEAKNGANSIVTAFVRAENTVVQPMAAGTYNLTSGFGFRADPFNGRAEMHTGQDFAAPKSTPIYAIADGTVLFVGRNSKTGINNSVIIQHEIDGKVFTSWYLHMYDNEILVSEGDTVKAGQHIAGVGSQGRSTGSHLHFEIRPGAGIDTTAVDPMPFMRSLGAIDPAQLCK
ncbi:MAG: M23 family metallopeptidase [Trueperella sp.]|nr:M23 family metallopeptidase [Trueperella sp.]